jgi:hypothetical protein
MQVTFLLPLGGDTPQAGYRGTGGSTRASRFARFDRWALSLEAARSRACPCGHPMWAWMAFDLGPEIWTDPAANRMEPRYRICGTDGRCVLVASQGSNTEYAEDHGGRKIFRRCAQSASMLHRGSVWCSGCSVLGICLHRRHTWTIRRTRMLSNGRVRSKCEGPCLMKTVSRIRRYRI